MERNRIKCLATHSQINSSASAVTDICNSKVLNKVTSYDTIYNTIRLRDETIVVIAWSLLVSVSA
jgi:hypothetical protein